MSNALLLLTTTLLLLLLVTPSAGYVKRAAVLETLTSEQREHFETVPDYEARRVARSFVQENPLGGRMEVRHEHELSGVCRSVDHESTIEALRCDPSDASISVRFAAGATVPRGWTVGAVLIGSEAWRCATRAVPTDTSAVRFVAGEYDAFVRRIHAVERDEQRNEWHFLTEPVEGTECLVSSVVHMRTHKPQNMTVADYMSALQEVCVCMCSEILIKFSPFFNNKKIIRARTHVAAHIEFGSQTSRVERDRRAVGNRFST